MTEGPTRKDRDCSTPQPCPFHIPTSGKGGESPLFQSKITGTSNASPSPRKWILLSALLFSLGSCSNLLLLCLNCPDAFSFPLCPRLRFPVQSILMDTVVFHLLWFGSWFLFCTILRHLLSYLGWIISTTQVRLSTLQDLSSTCLQSIKIYCMILISTCPQPQLKFTLFLLQFLS